MLHFTKKQITAFRRELERLKGEYNHGVMLFHKWNNIKKHMDGLQKEGIDTSGIKIGISKFSPKQHLKLSIRMDAREIEIFAQILNSNQKHIACNCSITCQSLENANHELGEAIRQQFPQGIEDSLCDQTFFSIHEDFLEDVLKFFEPLAENINVEKVDVSLSATNCANCLFKWDNVI